MHNKKHPWITVFKILIFFFCLLFYYSGILPLTIKGATPLLVLPILTAFSFFHSPLCCALTGLACGVFMDAVSLGSYCFNAIVLLLMGIFVALSSNNFFNKNIRSAVVISLITSTIYFVLLWLVFHTDSVTLTDSLIYLLKYAVPSAVYSALFILPFYYLFRYFYKRVSE